MSFPYAEIENIIGYTFREKALLKQAFTHSTYAHAQGGEDNERMEYLGDAVLQLIVTDWQYHSDAKASEGELTKERQLLVCENALDTAVRKLGLDKYLLLTGGKANVGKKTVSSLFETVTAAIYLDGGYAAAKEFIFRHAILKSQDVADNPKGALQEYLQSMGEQPPVYSFEKEGKDNAPIFRVKATALGQTAEGEGGNKKQAEAKAAAALLKALAKK